MSYLRKVKATCGRFVKKPNEPDDTPNYEDNNMSDADKIDNLKAKIYLKEKYNKALREEVSETHAGASNMIIDLLQENEQLLEDLDYEKNAEQHAVKKALRTHRLFQLAMTGKDAEFVISWLDDKLFDVSKILNEGIYLMGKMQDKIHEAERQVKLLEACPIPGSEPWEMQAEEDREKLESAIENMKANKSACFILHQKYRDIFYILKAESGKWPHLLETMERDFAELKKEQDSLEIMLGDANRFRDAESQRYIETDEESHRNRKQRRQQMNKMKKSVQKALEHNLRKYQTTTVRKDSSITDKKLRKEFPSVMNPSIAPSSKKLFTTADELKIKQAQIQEYEAYSNKIVDTMRVSDLNKCPKRLLTVRKVGEVLANELELKLRLKELYLKHKYRLELIHQYFKYTGCLRQEQFEDRIRDSEEHLALAQVEIDEKYRLINEIGKISVDLHYSALGMDDMLTQGKRTKSSAILKKEKLKEIMKRILEKIKALVNDVNKLNDAFKPDSKPKRNYAPFVQIPIPSRFVRVSSLEEGERDDDSMDSGDEYSDSKIPTRKELKAKSEKLYAQAMLMGKR